MSAQGEGIKWAETLLHHAANPDPISQHCAIRAQVLEDAASALRAALTRAEAAEKVLARVEEACLLACGDNSAARVGDDVDVDIGRFVLMDEDGEPVIDTDDCAEVVTRMAAIIGAAGENHEEMKKALAESWARETALQAAADELLTARNSLASANDDIRDLQERTARLTRELGAAREEIRKQVAGSKVVFGREVVEAASAARTTREGGADA